MQQQLFKPEQLNQIPSTEESINKIKMFIFGKWDATARSRFEMIKYIPFFVFEYYEYRKEIEAMDEGELDPLYTKFQNWLMIMGTKGMNEIQRAKFKLVVSKASFMKSYAVIRKWEQEYYEGLEWQQGIL